MPDLRPRHEAGVRLFFDNNELCDANDARKVVRFLSHYAEKEEGYDLVVHCHAGRSAAVAQFAADRFGAPIVNANPDTSGANRRLLRLLGKVFEGGQLTVFEPPKNPPRTLGTRYVTVSGIF